MVYHSENAVQSHYGEKSLTLLIVFTNSLKTTPAYISYSVQCSFYSIVQTIVAISCVSALRGTIQYPELSHSSIRICAYQRISDCTISKRC